MLTKHTLIGAIEGKIAAVVPFHPNIVSGLKLFMTVPLVTLALPPFKTFPYRVLMVIALFLTFVSLDYVAGVAARYRKMETRFGRILDHVTDYPILIVLSYLCLDIIPGMLLAGKLILDLLVIIINIIGREQNRNRIRTGINYTTLLALLMISQGWKPEIISPHFVVYLLYTNIAYTMVVALYESKILKKRFIADALSGANLLCGIFSIIFASRGRFDISLLFLMVGAAFDGFDGAVARKFGGTRLGVYSDDVADGVNYGIAPGVALYYALGGIDGLVIGSAFCIFTLSRLVYFTLNKAYSDPTFFCGVPSTAGGIITLCSIILFKEHAAVLGLMIGIACIQMVSFDTHYRHLGRALSSNRRIIYGMPVLIILLIIGNFLWSKEGPVAIILCATLIYGFIPVSMHFAHLIRKEETPKEHP
ncbi:MAG: CDP-alcohol phosphatidyltransferase family protein [Thermodesulfovibrionales bacterium]